MNYDIMMQSCCCCRCR